jgi:hypothetical protein
MDQTTNSTRTQEIARRLAQLGQEEDARRAYLLLLHQAQEAGEPGPMLEAALYLFQNGGDYKVSYTAFQQLYNQGYCREELLSLMTGAFYTPNEKLMKSRYEKNCKLLAKYPYLFRKDFPAFEDLPLRFFPYDDNGYLPFDRAGERFGGYVNFKYPKITRNFFKDLDKPILADDVYSAYELHYLRDNVRKSEWVGKENHIYLHYTDWATFCAYLQVLNFRTLLEEEKFVFLMEDEISQYPIDFKERFGIDYSKYPVEPLHIREVNRLIWHTQLSAHNGGDFFNEIFDGHPNLIVLPSIMLSNIQNTVNTVRAAVHRGDAVQFQVPEDGDLTKCCRLLAEINGMKHPTEKDILVFCYMCVSDLRSLDPASRIAPALLVQPHFPNLVYSANADPRGDTVLESKQYQEIKDSNMLTAFPYIKTFTPMRRMTSSYGASVRFMHDQIKAYKAELEAGEVQEDQEDGAPKKMKVLDDELIVRTLNRSFMWDPEDRLFQDSVLVRFEDGKLNPRATFTALAAFLDIPYTESMTYCSYIGERDPLSFEGNARGFDPARLYTTYEEYAGVPERTYLEYFMRDAYEYYGYDFNYYDGTPMDMDRIRDLVDHITVQDDIARISWGDAARYAVEQWIKLGSVEDTQAARDSLCQQMVDGKIKSYRDNRIHVAEVLMRGLRFVSKNGQPLRMMPKLELDPDLLDQPLYH